MRNRHVKLETSRSARTGHIVPINGDKLDFVSGGVCYIDQNGELVCEAGKKP